MPKEAVDKAVVEISKYLDIIEKMIAGPYVAGSEMSLGDWNLGGTRGLNWRSVTESSSQSAILPTVPMVTIFWGRKGFDAFKNRPKLTAW